MITMIVEGVKYKTDGGIFIRVQFIERVSTEVRLN